MVRLFTCVFVLAGVSACFGDLRPDEIAIVAKRASRESEGLAKYYARMRGIPAKNLCLVDLPRGETMERETWTWAVRPEIRKWVTENDPDEKLRCLVTVWDVPLRIGPSQDDDQSYTEFLERERAGRLERLRQHIADFGGLGGGATAGNATAAGSAGPDGGETSVGVAGAGSETPETAAGKQAGGEIGSLQTELEAALQAAQQRLSKLPAGDERTGGQQRLEQLATNSGGVRVILQALGQRLQRTAEGDANRAAIQATFAQLQGRLTGYAEARALLEQMPPAVERDALILAMIERMGGLVATVEWLDEQLKMVAKNETAASFDSELSLVMWPDDYELVRWQPNYLRPGFDNSQLRTAYRTLMVARIDAPTLRLCKGLIDTAMQVEKEGLKGKVYIDGRGIGKLDDANVSSGSYADFDRALLITAKGIQEQFDWEVVLDEQPQLFQAGQCPDAALYCGWYSLAKYVDAFDWVPGAVGYHLASAEATTLRNVKSQVWCKRMLEDGVCATIGPVYEPYLMAFPRPNEFFAFLLQGDLTLVECYYRAKPYNSWMMTLVGDPLYRPVRRE